MPKPTPSAKQQGKAYDKDEILQSLKPYFMLGYNRTRACTLALFNPTTLSNWEAADATITVQINAWIEYANHKARSNVVESIEKGDKDLSKWWLERKDRNDFATRQESTGNDGNPIEINTKDITDPVKEKMLADAITKAFEDLTK